MKNSYGVLVLGVYVIISEWVCVLLLRKSMEKTMELVLLLLAETF